MPDTHDVEDAPAVRQLKPTLRLYVLAVIAAGLCSVLLALLAQPPLITDGRILLAVLLTALTASTRLAPIKLVAHQEVVLDTSLSVVAILVLSPGEGGFIIGLGTLAGNVLHSRRPWFNAWFNAAQTALSVVVAGIIYRSLAPASLADPGRGIAGALALIPAAVTLYLVSALLVDGAAAMQRRRSPLHQWFTTHRAEFVPHAVLVIAGAATAPAAARMPWLLLFAAAPVVVLRLLVLATLRFDRDAVALGERLIDDLEAHVPGLAGQSQQMSTLAFKLAGARGMNADDCRRVALAARLHHLGALTRPHEVLRDAVLVDAHRRAYLDGHAVDAAGYAAQTLRLPLVADVLRHHHEWFNGQGGPSGLAGIDIPLESRIVGLVEAWVTLTAAGSYRPPLTVAQARTVLRACRGVQWDPILVDLLDRVIAQSSPATVTNEPVQELRHVELRAPG